MKYICQICGYVYDEAVNGPFTDLPEDWKCPLCGTSKGDFAPEKTAQPPEETTGKIQRRETDMKPLTAAETSALCTNLAKGCEKQYRPDQADAFRRLAAWFASLRNASAG